MNPYQVSQDDLQDVADMTKDLEKYINNIFEENELTLVMSALISSTVNCTLSRCHSIEEMIFYKNIFYEIFDNTIRFTKIIDK